MAIGFNTLEDECAGSFLIYKVKETLEGELGSLNSSCVDFNVKVEDCCGPRVREVDFTFVEERNRIERPAGVTVNSNPFIIVLILG